jgi:hypothetical protein
MSSPAPTPTPTSATAPESENLTAQTSTPPPTGTNDPVVDAAASTNTPDSSTQNTAPTGGSKTRKGNKALSEWVTFVKQVQKEENLSYSKAMKRASKRKAEWKRGGNNNAEKNTSIGGKKNTKKRRTAKNKNGNKKRR